MAAGGDVPPAPELRVHRRVDAAAPPALARHEMGDEPVETPVDEHGAEVDRHPRGVARPQPALVTGAAERPAEVAAEQPERGHGLTGAARPLDDGACLRVGSDDDGIGWHRAALAPLLTLLDRHPAIPPPRTKPR